MVGYHFPSCLISLFLLLDDEGKGKDGLSAGIIVVIVIAVIIIVALIVVGILYHRGVIFSKEKSSKLI